MQTPVRVNSVEGGWFPSGFYGHFRSKSRNDIYGEFRRLCTPKPPGRFTSRMQKSVQVHPFSRHDNRFSFVTDATYLDMGVGKKRKAKSARAMQSDTSLLHWPHDHDCMTPHTHTTYRKTFGPADDVPVSSFLQIKPIMKHFQMTDANPDRKSSYYTESFSPPPIDSLETKRLSRPKTCQPRSSVAECLVWHRE